MTKEEKYFHKVGEGIASSANGQLFGKLCYKINGKAFCCFFENEMVFKLAAEMRSEALSLHGSQLFDPSKKGRAMKEWVQLPFEYHKNWVRYAQAAREYVEVK